MYGLVYVLCLLEIVRAGERGGGEALFALNRGGIQPFNQTTTPWPLQQTGKTEASQCRVKDLRIFDHTLPSLSSSSSSSSSLLLLSPPPPEEARQGAVACCGYILFIGIRTLFDRVARGILVTIRQGAVARRERRRVGGYVELVAASSWWLRRVGGCD